MSSRQGFPADTLVADDVVPRMRTSRISSHYRANTVSNSRRSHGLKAARKPLGDRNAKSVVEGANGRNAEATKKATVSAVSKTQHSSLSSLSDRCSSRHAVAPVSAGDEPKNAKKTTAKTTPLTVPNNDKENQQTAKSNTLTHRRTPSSKHNKQDLTIAKKSPSSVLKTRKPAVIAHPRSAAAAENNNKVPKSAMKVGTSRASARKVTFTPATKTDNQRGSNLNSLRRSLRASMTPPSKQQTQPQTQQQSTITSNDISVPNPYYRQQKEIFDSPDRFTSSTTPPSSSHFDLPKTPKSILKDQLDDMSMDESMLLSPGQHTVNENDNINTPFLTSTSSSIDEDDDHLFDNPLSPKIETFVAPISKNTNETKTNKLTRKINNSTSAAKSTIASRKEYLFVGSKRSSRQQEKTMQVVASTKPETMSRKPYETPQIPPDSTSQAIVAQQQQALATATPFSLRGNGVCLDLSSVFFNEPKTIRRANKSTRDSEVKLKVKSKSDPIDSCIIKLKTKSKSDPIDSSMNHENPRIKSKVAIVGSAEEEWAEKQCDTFSKWLNFTLQPTGPSEDSDQKQELLCDFTAISGSKSGEMAPATSGSSGGLRSLVLHQRLAKARGTGSILFASTEMQNIIKTIDTEVDKGKLSLRQDRDMYADLTQRGKIISLLFSYSTPWLRLGLETMFSTTILPEVLTQCSPVKNDIDSAKSRSTPAYQMRLALRDFIVNRVLSDDSVLAKYTKGKCRVPSGPFEKRYRAEIRPLVLRRLLKLFFFLDRAKMANILDKSPRLFTKAAPVKSSRDVLISFCRDFLASEGDITKHLRRVGLKVAYNQDPIDEIELGISNFAIDLRDGIRLTKLSEILTGATHKSLLRVLRIPAVSRLQKLHNVGVALEALRKAGVAVSEDIAPHHIVDGQRSTVLKLMWIIIAHYCFPSVLDTEKLEAEISDLQQRGGKDTGQDQKLLSKESSSEEKSKHLLVRWCNAVGSLFGLEVTDLSTSFADGKALATIVHYYHPTLLSRREIRPTTRDMTYNSSRRRLTVEQARCNEKLNSALAHARLSELGGIPAMSPSSSVPDEKSMMLYLCYASSRLIDSRQEIQACRKIQRKYLSYRTKRIRALQECAASLLFRQWRLRKVTYFQNQCNKYAGPVAIIEAFVLARRQALELMKEARQEREMRCAAVLSLQVQVRRVLATHRVSILRSKTKAAVNMQRCFRMRNARRKCKVLAQVESSVIQLQSLWRGYTRRKTFSATMTSTVWVQARARKQIAQQRFLVLRSASILIQKQWRSFSGQLQYQLSLMDIVTAQSLARRKSATRRLRTSLAAVNLLQCAVRCLLARDILPQKRWAAAQSRLRNHNSAVACQSTIRAFLASRKTAHFRSQFIAASTLQQVWLERQKRVSFQQNEAAAKIQSLQRMAVVNRSFVIQKAAVKYLQFAWRKHRALDRVVRFQAQARSWLYRRHYNVQKDATNGLQRAIRRYLAQQQALTEAASVMVQKQWRSYQQRKVFHRKRILAMAMATLFRAHQIRSHQSHVNRNATLIQAIIRGYVARSERVRSVQAIVQIQGQWRCYCAMQCYRLHRNSAVRIQAWFCRQSARLQVRQRVIYQNALSCMLQQSQTQSQFMRSTAKCIQDRWRSYQSRSNFTLLRNRVVILQALARKKSCSARRERQMKQIVMVQAYVRQKICSKHYQQAKRDSSLRKMANSSLLQAQIRGFLVRQHLQLMIMNAMVVQSRWKGYVHRKRYQQTKQKIVLLQNLFRQMVARREFTERQKNATKIQQWIRLRIAQEQLLFLQKQLIQSKANGALVLQSLYRGHIARRRIRNLHQSARLIQQKWNAYLTMLEHRLTIFDITIIQTLARRWLAMQNLRKRESAIIRMQLVARMWLSSRLAKDKFAIIQSVRGKNKAATQMQSLYRGRVARIQTNQVRAARNIQKTWRAYTQHVDFMLLLLTTYDIQARIRGILGRRSYKIKLASIISIQNAFRGFLGRRKVTAARLDADRYNAAVTIQKVWRGFTHHVSYMLQYMSAVDIQRAIRGYMAKKERAHLEEERYRAMLPCAAAIIQRAALLFLATRARKKLMRQVTRFQALWKGHAVRRKRNKRLVITANRLKQAHLRAVKAPNSQLGTRFQQALDTLLRSQSLHELLSAVATLEWSTRYSRKACADFARCNATDILLSVILQCNRSIPHVEVLGFIVGTLLNCAKHGDLVAEISSVRATDRLLDLLQSFRYVIFIPDPDFCDDII